MVVAAACASDSGSGSDGADGEPARSVAVADPPLVTAVTDTAVADTQVVDTQLVDTQLVDTVAVDDSPVCGGLSAAAVGTAVGAAFDTADDISVDADLSCLFSDAMATDGVTVLTESADTYLGGSLAGLSVQDALRQLETAQSMFLDAGYTVERATIGGFPAIVVTGTNSVAAIPTGYAATVADGVVVEVTLDGANLAPDAAGLGPLGAGVLELAVAARG